MVNTRVDFNINKQEVVINNIPELSIVCVIHNQFALLQSELIKLLTYISGLNVEVVMWDNASTDFTKELFKRKLPSTRLRYFHSPILQTTEEAYLEAEKRAMSGKILRVLLDKLPDKSSLDLNYISKLISAPSPTFVQKILNKAESVEQSSTPGCISRILNEVGMPIGIREDVSLLKRDLEERGWVGIAEPERGVIYFNTDICGVVLKTATDKSWFYISGSGRKRFSVDQTTSFLRCPG